LSVSPFAEGGLDEALRLSVGLRRIRPGADVLEAESAAGIAELLCAIAGSVVGHDTLDGDAEALIVGDGGLEEGDGTFLLLVWKNPGESDARSVIDADMDELPAGTAGFALLAVSGDAVTDTIEAAEFLDVDVDQLAGMIPLVAAHWLGRLKRLNAVETEAFEDAADGCRRDADFGRDMLAGETLAAKGLDVGGHRGRRRLAQAMRPR